MIADLFSGEFLIRDDGIYTHIHLYRHPDTGKSVKLCGMNHAGDREYFEAVGKELSGCDTVLYEASSSIKQSPKEIIESLKDVALPEAPLEEQLRHVLPEIGRYRVPDLMKVIRKADITTAFSHLLRSYFISAQAYHDMYAESEAFDYNKEGWTPVDLLLDEKRTEEIMTSLDEALRVVPRDYFIQAIQMLSGKHRKMHWGEHHLSDIGEVFVGMYSDVSACHAFVDTLARPRDEHLFSVFDGVDSDSIGIKYGAAHIPYQRKLLEERGYILERTITLKAVSFT